MGMRQRVDVAGIWDSPGGLRMPIVLVEGNDVAGSYNVY